jgi:hypothetical protein
VKRNLFRWEWIAALALGFMAGLAYAWLVSPVKYVDAEPKTLRADFKDDFRSAIAAAFTSNGDLDRARARLALLGEEDPAQTLTAQAQRMLASGESFESIQKVARLAAALQGQLAANPTATIPVPATTSTGEIAQGEGDLSPTLTLEASSQILQAESTITSVPPFTATPKPTRTITPTLGAPFQLTVQETVCDPQLLEGLLQVVVTNALRQQIPGVEIIISWNNGEEHFFTGLKPEIGNGYADFVMEPGTEYSLRLVEGGSPVSNLSTPTCTDSDGNPYSGGVRLTFQQP